jgi:3-(3-hydroxy-phenyl)propionate hydroxylase
MRWQSEMAAIVPGNDGVTLDIATPSGNYRLDANYVLAADGARSPIRTMLGLRLKGENYEGRYVIADIRMDHDFPTERRAFFDPSGNPGGTVLIHKQPDDLWRVDYQLKEGESEEEALREENIRARVTAILADIGHIKPWELEWWSVYSANTLCLDDYRHGRVFFIGDAAHIVPIFGVRGLNNGLADADNIAWKLARMLQDNAADSLLDSYSPERRGATLDVFANATKSTRFMTPADPRLAAGTRGRTVTQPQARVSPRACQPAPDAALHLFGKPADALPRPRRGVCVGPGLRQRFSQRKTPRRVVPARWCRLRPDGPAILRGCTERRTGIPARPASRARQSLCRRSSSGAAARRPARSTTATATSPACSNAGPGTLYLLRPDLHIAGRWKAVAADEVLRTARLCLGIAKP